jgi:hypothetical protein
VETVTVESLEAFTGFVERSFNGGSEVLFRGQPRDMPLVPSLARERLASGNLLDAERAMLDEFRRHSIAHLRVLPPTLWDWVALAQHHGLPTRLLDWTLNPLTSLWFAVRRPPHGNTNGVVWVLCPAADDYARDDEKDAFPTDRHRVYAPVHVSDRIIAQGAWSTIHHASSEPPHFEPFEESEEFGQKLIKVVIPPGRFAHFRTYLNRYGVNSASIFPGLDGICEYVRWKHFLVPDEKA